MDYNAWRHLVNEVREEEVEHRRTFIGPAYPSLSIGVSDRIAFKLFAKVEELAAEVKALVDNVKELEGKLEDQASAISLMAPEPAAEEQLDSLPEEVS